MSVFGSFKGGVHPPGHKEPTECKPIESMPPPALAIIPLQQHTGAMCEPIVAVGAEVREGQRELREAVKEARAAAYDADSGSEA